MASPQPIHSLLVSWEKHVEECGCFKGLVESSGETILTWDLLFRCSKILSLISTMVTGIFAYWLLDEL